MLLCPPLPFHNAFYKPTTETECVITIQAKSYERGSLIHVAKISAQFQSENGIFSQFANSDFSLHPARIHA
jgi:hypothetical protein